MPLPMGDFVRAQFGGTLGGENWECGLWFHLVGMTDAPDQSAMDSFAADVLSGANLQIWDKDGEGILASNATGVDLSTSRASFYRDGASLGSGTASMTPSPGTNSTAAHPFYCALCVTTLTATAGRRGRGRMYLPLTGGAVSQTSGQVSSGVAQAFGDAVGNFLFFFNGDDSDLPGSPTTVPVVVSQVEGAFAVITSLRTDTKPDTQHGRTNRVAAAAVTNSAIAAGG